VVDRVEHVMGIPVGIGSDLDPAAAFACLQRVDELFSTWREDSEISRLHAGTLALLDASADVRAVLRRCERLRRETGGRFDVRATGRLDPSGFVKGWAVERAVELLVAEGAGNVCVHAGGDVRVLGERGPGRPWRVGVRHPLRRDRVAAVIEARDLAVATSGAYERGEHVVDPRSGRPPDGVLSVTVAGPDLGTADAYATAAFAMGLDGPEWAARLRGYEAMTILADGRMLTTPGMPVRWPSTPAGPAHSPPAPGAPGACPPRGYGLHPRGSGRTSSPWAPRRARPRPRRAAPR
jgi:thiamine biosynthesis lipoprotein